MSLYKKYRPRTLAAVVGQTGAVASLQKLMDRNELPHCILLTGPSGTGKTTIGRIIKRHLKCGNADYAEVDCALVSKPLETVREIKRASNLCPIEGDCRIWFLEEAQSLSRAGFSQQAMLKLLEDVSDSVYFILATTDPQKLHRAVHTRCTEVKLSALSVPVLEELVRFVAKQEGMKVSDEVITEIVEAAEGSARKALVVLEQVGSLSEEEQHKAVLVSSLEKDQAIVLARALINPRVQWKEVAAVLKDLNSEDPEGLRNLVLVYSRSVLLGGSPLAQRAFMIIDYFSENFYDSKQAGLAAACWAVVHHR
jgi:DNA polymerase III gamma/tau subunit